MYILQLPRTPEKTKTAFHGEVTHAYKCLFLNHHIHDEYLFALLSLYFMTNMFPLLYILNIHIDIIVVVWHHIDLLKIASYTSRSRKS